MGFVKVQNEIWMIFCDKILPMLLVCWNCCSYFFITWTLMSGWAIRWWRSPSRTLSSSTSAPPSRWPAASTRPRHPLSRWTALATSLLGLPHCFGPWWLLLGGQAASYFSAIRIIFHKQHSPHICHRGAFGHGLGCSSLSVRWPWYYSYNLLLI